MKVDPVRTEVLGFECLSRNGGHESIEENELFNVVLCFFETAAFFVGRFYEGVSKMKCDPPRLAPSGAVEC